jgi:hypothetical protein
MFSDAMNTPTLSAVTILAGALLTTFLSSCGPDYRERHDEPMTLNEALSAKIDFPFPHGARNIQFAAYSDWQMYQKLIRFEAPVQECVQASPMSLADPSTSSG